jgi:hypothetical protein
MTFDRPLVRLAAELPPAVTRFTRRRHSAGIEESEVDPGESQIGDPTMNTPKFQSVDPAANPNPTEAIPDPLDLNNLRLSQSFVETAGVKKLLRTVPVHKPNPQDFVRVHPSPEFRADFPVIELKEEREEYIVTSKLVPELVGEFASKTLFTAINKQGVIFLWPVRLPDPDGKWMEWWRSMREAAELAMTQWVRVKANMSLGAYEMFIAEGHMGDPAWPEVTYQELIRLAFRDRLIISPDHTVVKRLRGQA